MKKRIYADAGDEGFRFLFPSLSPDSDPARPSDEPERDGGGLRRDRNRGHFATIVGRGGTGKSSLALQIVSELLNEEEKALDTEHQHAVFYFTLEATPYELFHQASQYEWAKRYTTEPDENVVAAHESNGLFIVPVPSPVSDLNALILSVRQTIAEKLASFSHLTAIVIDPLGGVSLKEGIRSELSQLRDLATSHKTFLFLLVEDHIFKQHRSIEHYSKTIIHLEHDPQEQPYRRLYIQKARGQSFRSGYHQLEFDSRRGLRVFPSIQAQSAYAHKKKVREPVSPQAEPFFKNEDGRDFREKIARGSVAFLMGPPGTFKQTIATRFVVTVEHHEPSIYISFKADFDSVRGHVGKRADVVKLHSNSAHKGIPTVYFMDARSPILTPELILSDVQNAIRRFSFSRAVVWGLRRLNDMPNFSGGKAVQFLEALVTLLQSENTTSLLVDWPDIEKASTLPIVDLSQYIFLTRVCRSRDEIISDIKNSGAFDTMGDGESSKLKEYMDILWGKESEHVTLLRIQRTRAGFHRSRGAIFHKEWNVDHVKTTDDPAIDRYFERLWKVFGIQWEKDPGLVH